MRLIDILTEAEIQRAIDLYSSAPREAFAAQCAETIIAPVIERINSKTGQENDPRYLAYVILNACMQNKSLLSKTRL